ncbi:ArsR/SmtB family transcription factor [Dongia sp.]|uniref:ArsR/SmtB family transcription factor n=1 Tax=Dongia sp. TaxID=1977262 RepID=UPI0035ADB7D6
MTRIQVTIAPGFELCLAFEAGNGDGQGLELAAEVGPLLAGCDSAALTAALAGRPAENLRAFAAGDFASFWQRHAGAYAAAADRLRAVLAAHPRADLGTLFGFDIALDLQHLGLRQRKGAARRIPATQIDNVLLYPSAFNRRHFWCLEPAGAAHYRVHLPVFDAELAQAVQAANRPQRAEPAMAGDFAAICRALGDASRLAMARMMAAQTITGAEIARRLHLSTPAVTHHLNILRQAGLVEESRAGTAIQLRLRHDRIEGLGTLGGEYLFGGGAPPPQRSRRRAI